MRHSKKTLTATDTCVLINFCHIKRLSLLGELSGYRFILPDAVYAEITYAKQKVSIDAQIKAGNLGRESITDEKMDEFQLYNDLVASGIERGEAACLTLAKTRGYHLASDDARNPFLRKAIELIGEERILKTEDLLLECIRNGLITVAQADEYKAIMADNHYTMPFESFQKFFDD